MTASTAVAQQPNLARHRFSPEQVRTVAPVLEQYTQDCLYKDVWNRPGLVAGHIGIFAVFYASAVASMLAIPFAPTCRGVAVG